MEKRLTELTPTIPAQRPATPPMSPADLAAHIAASHLSPKGVAYLARCEKALRKAVAA